jgi:hypothetical protein
VASYIGRRADDEEIEKFLAGTSGYSGKIRIPGIDNTIKISVSWIRNMAEKYLLAAIKAGEVYTKIEKAKGAGNFVAEVSMDEVPSPQTSVELLFILKMLADRKIQLQTIAPKFSGRFNKGVDYVGDILQFTDEFEKDLLVLDFAVKEFGLPGNLKLSIHSGSDKFTLYPVIAALTGKHDKGIHIKTAGTTWLEEVIGLATAGGEALSFVKELYIKALEKREELCAPYSDVININPSGLPSGEEVLGWNSSKFAGSIRHIPDNPDYNSNMRQLMHVCYKLAAERMEEYFSLLDTHTDVVADCVFENIYSRHICRLFNLNSW